MKSNHKKRILLLITNSYAATNVIHSGLIKPLADENEIYILSDFITEKELITINQTYSINARILHGLIPTEKPVVRLMRLPEKHVFFHFFNIETQKIKEKEGKNWFSIFVRPLFNLLRVIRFSEYAIKFLRQNIIAYSAKNPGLKTLQNFHFDGVISSSPLDPRENAIVNFLNKRQVRSLAMIISWDNLTSKGIVNADHDYVLVWNELMAHEYHTFYDLFKATKTKVCITGVPRFDIYFNDLPEEFSEPEFRKRYQFKMEDKIILFTTSALNHFPDQVDIVRHLLEYTKKKTNVKILIRCHAGDDFNIYKEFITLPDVRIWYPENTKNSPVSKQMPDLHALNGLAEMLKYSDLCINIASTIRLEAAVCNKPCISIAYDGDITLPFYRSVRRLYRYSHQLPLNKAKIDKMVFSKYELFQTLDTMLYAQVHEPTYADAIWKFVPNTGATAVAETMKYVRQWLD